MGEHARRQVPLKERRIAARIRLRIDRSLGLETPEWIRELALEDGEGASVTKEDYKRGFADGVESMRPLDSAPWLCERWRDTNFARSGTPTDDYNVWAPRKGYAQDRSRYGY